MEEVDDGIGDDDDGDFDDSDDDAIGVFDDDDDDHLILCESCQELGNLRLKQQLHRVLQPEKYVLYYYFPLLHLYWFVIALYFGTEQLRNESVVPTLWCSMPDGHKTTPGLGVWSLVTSLFTSHNGQHFI